MNLVLDVNFKKKLEAEDILYFDGKSWTNLSKSEYLAQLLQKVNALEAKYEKLENSNKELAQKVAELRGEE